MCIVFCYRHDQDSEIGYDLILLSNRDEDFQRPARSAHVWENTKYVIGGQDQTSSREGGTWLSMNVVQEKIGVLLNLPSRLKDKQIEQALSRGFLVPNFVNDDKVELDSYFEHLNTIKMNFTGFNYLGLQRDSARWRIKYVNNLSVESTPMEIETCLFGFSNHIYGNSTEFDKTRRGCRLFDEVLRFSTENFTKKIDDEEKFIENLFGILRDDRTSHDDSNLQETYRHYEREVQHQISSIFVRPEKLKNYGTRSSTIILIRHDQSGIFIEESLADPMNDRSLKRKEIWKFQLKQNDVAPENLSE